MNPWLRVLRKGRSEARKTTRRAMAGAFEYPAMPLGFICLGFICDKIQRCQPGVSLWARTGIGRSEWAQIPARQGSCAMPREPLVSIVITTFNQAPYVVAALESVFSQTFERYEVIVVDDGSTDYTPRVLEPFEPRITYVRQANQGIAAARNTGVSHAKGELVAFLDGDDLWEPAKLACQVEAALAHPKSGLIASDGVQFDDTGLIDESLIGPSVRVLMNPGLGIATIQAFQHLLMGNFIATVSQVMIPRAVLESIGPSDPSFALVSDWDLYLRISRRYPVSLLSRKLVRWRYLTTSASGPEALRRLRWGLEGVSLLDKHVRLASSDLRPLL